MFSLISNNAAQHWGTGAAQQTIMPQNYMVWKS